MLGLSGHEAARLRNTKYSACRCCHSERTSDASLVRVLPAPLRRHFEFRSIRSNEASSIYVASYEIKRGIYTDCIQPQEKFAMRVLGSSSLLI